MHAFATAIAYLTIGAVLGGVFVGFAPKARPMASLGRAAAMTVGWIVLPFIFMSYGLGLVILKVRGKSHLTNQ